MKRHVYVTFAPLPRDWEIYHWRCEWSWNYAFGPFRIECISD